MNFIDLVILIIVLGVLGAIAYFNFIKKEEDVCRNCPYKKPDCDCGKRKRDVSSWDILSRQGQMLK